MRVLASFLLLAAVMLLPCAVAECATAREPAYKAVTLVHNYPWPEGLSLRFATDEQLCRAKYGQNWQVRCAAELGEPGATATGVRLTPPLDGHWEWRHSGRMDFVLAAGEAPAPETTYTVDLEGMRLPASVKLDKTRLSLRTPPLSVRLQEGRFWVDPSPQARHRLAVSLEFNFPVGAKEPVIRCSAPGVAFGEPERVWNAARDRLNLAFPVTKLPSETVEARIVVEGLPSFSPEDGTLGPRAQGQEGDTAFRVSVTGSRSLFAVRAAALEIAPDDNLNKEYVLTVETSLYVSPEEVLRHLDVRQLPRFNTPADSRPYNWLAAPVVPAEALERGRKLTPVSLMPDNTPVSRLRFRLPAEADSYLLVGVHERCAAASGLTLGKPWRKILRVGKAGADLDFLQPGNVLSLSGENTLDIYATNLDAVRWEAQLVRDPFLALLAQGSSRSFTEPLAESNLGLEALSESVRGELPLPAVAPGAAQFAGLNLSPVLDAAGSDARGLLRVNLIGLKDGKEAAFASRMVLVTDLGLLVKRTALGGYDAFVHSFRTGQPVAGVRVSVLGANGKPVAGGNTDAGGHVAFPPLGGLAREGRPVAVVAEYAGGKRGDLAWLPLTDVSRELNFSDFPVGGKLSSPDGLMAFVFAQRGMFRPGEVLHFGCVLRRADWAALPPDLPLVAQVRNPLGKIVLKRPFTAGESGMAIFDWASPETAPSGSYTLSVLTAGGAEMLGSTQVRVESFQPDTLALKLERPASKGWLVVDGKTPPRLGARLTNLHGAPAVGHAVRGQAIFAPARFVFPGWEEFTFLDPAPFAGTEQRRDLAESLTDKDGMAGLTLPAGLPGLASARCTLSVEGFEAGGGRPTVARTSFLISPRTSLLGYRPVGALTNLQFIPQHGRAELEFVAINPELARIPLDDLTFSVFERRYVTSLVRDAAGDFRYDETPVDAPVSRVRRQVGAVGLRFALDTAEAGEYLLAVRDASGALLASVPYVVAGERPLPPGAELASGRMRLRLDKTAYAAGETMRLAMSLPYDGTGLITLERDGVAAFAWFTARAGDTVQHLTVPEDFEGRGYVNVSFVRAPEAGAAYMTPHTYAVAPFTSNIRQRDMGLSIEAPESALPGTALRVTLRARRAGKAVLFAVDEGVLQLTRFATPSPLDSLLADRALEVRTFQALDLLMPRRLSPFGGGDGGGMGGGRFQNPFKRREEPPVATWSALLDVTPEGTSVEIPLPSYYNGKLRLMAVGASPGAAGSAARANTVAAPLVLTPQLPLTVSPGDVFAGTLVLANTTDQPLRAEVAAEADAGLAFLNGLPPEAEVGARAEIVLPFRMRAGEQPGAADVRFTARGGDRTYARTASLSVRPASPLRTSVQAGSATASTSLPTDRLVHAFGAHSSASLSALPLPLVRGFADYLRAYPYGCTEQLVSRALVRVLLRAYPGILADEKENEAILESAIGAIRERLTPDGLALWPDGPADPLLTVYAADFLLAMREAGRGGAEDLLQQVCDAVERVAALNETSLAAARTSAYAIWVLTREGRVTTQLLENLRETLGERKVADWETDLTAVLMAASRRQMHMRDSEPPAVVEYRPAGWFDALAQQALHMSLLARHFPAQCADEHRNDLFEAAVMALRSGSYATFSAAQGARALLAVGAGAAADMTRARLTCVDGDGEAREAVLAEGMLLTVDMPQCRRYALTLPADSPRCYWQVATTGYDVRPPDTAAANGLEVSRVYLDAQGEPIQSARQGDVLTVRISVRAQRQAAADCVISDLLPGGCEMVLPRPGEAEAAQPQGLKFAERREDRLLLFADVGREALVYTYRIRAVNRGTFLVPPIVAQAMYDQACNGHSAAGTLEVR